MTTYELSRDTARIDRDRVWRWLHEESYWAHGRTRAMVDSTIDVSRNYGVYCGEEQVGFARVVTDGHTFAWVCDVFVDSAHRGEGIGKMLVSAIVADSDAADIRRTMLMTLDAQGLYGQFGFETPPDADRTMLRLRASER